MSEIIARVADGRLIELIDDKNNLISSVPMQPKDAAFLARGLLASAEVLVSPTAVTIGQIIADAHIPIMKWVVGTSRLSGAPVMALTLPTGIEITFEIPPQGAKELGAALVGQGAGSAPLGGRSGTVH